MNDMSKEEGSGGIIVKLSTIVTLDKLDTALEMCKSIGMEVLENSKCVGFLLEGERPQMMSKII